MSPEGRIDEASRHEDEGDQIGQGPRDPFDPDAPAISSNVPMIIGSCLEDSSYNLPEIADDEAALRGWLE